MKKLFHCYLGRRVCSLILLITLLINVLIDPLVAYAAPKQQAAAPRQPPTLQECNQVAEETLQDELNNIAQQVFANDVAQLDVTALVNSQWRALQVNLVIDAEVDRAVERVKNERDVWDKFLSGWSPDKAQELTREVANYAFESQPFRAKLDELSSAVAHDLSEQIALLSAESVSAAFFCLQTFIGGNYSAALVGVFENAVREAAQKVDFAASPQFDANIMSVMDQHANALGGVGVIIAAQLARNIMLSIGESIAERAAGGIVGRVLGRAGSSIIPVVGWLLGLGLIAYDVYESRDGALPDIQTTLKSQSVKDGVQSEIVASITPELRRSLPEIARNVANELYSRWREVKKSIRQVLDLSEQNPRFQTLLAGAKDSNEVAKLVELVGVALPALGKAGLEAAIADGTLQRAYAQPATAFVIVESTKSLQSAIDWSQQAGALIDQVVDYEIYKQKGPQDLSRATLEKLIALNDRPAIAKLALLSGVEIDTLLNVSSENLTSLSNRLSAQELQQLAQYLPQMGPVQKNTLVTRLLSEPGVMAQLQDPRIATYLSSNPNINDALDFLVGPRDALAVVNDTVKIFSGQASWQLFRYKYGTLSTVVIALASLLVLWFVLWLLWLVLRTFLRIIIFLARLGRI